MQATIMYLPSIIVKASLLFSLAQVPPIFLRSYSEVSNTIQNMPLLHSNSFIVACLILGKFKTFIDLTHSCLSEFICFHSLHGVSQWPPFLWCKYYRHIPTSEPLNCSPLLEMCFPQIATRHFPLIPSGLFSMSPHQQVTVYSVYWEIGRDG